MRAAVGGLLCAAMFFVSPLAAAEYKTPHDLISGHLRGNELKAYIAGFMFAHRLIDNFPKRPICPPPGTSLKELEAVAINKLAQEVGLQPKYRESEVGGSMVLAALWEKFPCKWD